ncbi:hypothetical protein HDU79_002180, partial [Rhizoclosmatium sp. JEL0117]
MNKLLLQCEETTQKIAESRVMSAGFNPDYLHPSGSVFLWGFGGISYNQVKHTQGPSFYQLCNIVHLTASKKGTEFFEYQFKEKILMARKHKDEAQEIKYNAQTGVAIDRDWDHCFQNYLPLIGSTLMSEDVASEAKI